MTSLFDPAPGIVGRDHPQTSRDAAAQIEPSTGTQRRRILDFVRAIGGATDREIQAALGIDGNTERPRRTELVAAGLVADSGITRRGPNGRRAIVWTAT